MQTMQHIHGSYDSSLVLLSYVIAVIASYAALDLAGRVSAARAGKGRAYWLGGGATFMGIGMWSMHFVGMLAYSMSAKVEYDIPLVAISVVVAILASLVALQVVGLAKSSRKRLLSGGFLMAAGMVAMHYSGMAAMDVRIHYDAERVALSALIAVVASIAALRLAFNLRGVRSWKAVGYKLGSGLVMGAAIAGMHYTGMSAARFDLDVSAMAESGLNMNQDALAYTIAAGAIFALAVALLGAFVDKRLSSKDDALYEHGKWYKSLYENHSDGILTVDMRNVVVNVNPAFQEMTGRDASYFLERPLGELATLLVPEQREKTSEWVRQARQAELVQRIETAVTHASGEYVYMSAMSVPVKLEDEMKGTYLIFRDITEEKRSKERIRHLAYHDELTRLPNRRMVNLTLEQTIRRNDSAGGKFAVMVFDIDRFKLINDLLGHAYGDLFLQQVTDRLHRVAAGMNVTVGRIGGDEFAVVCQGEPIEEAAVQAAERIVAAMQAPYRLNDNDFYVSASIGIALYPAHGRSGNELLKKADAAMYDVKRKGKNGYRFYSEQLDEHLLGQIEMESDLRKAVERGELLLHYQPQLNSREDEIIGFEALLRWQHPERGLVPPGVFIPVAEEAGIIGDIGAWTLREACRQMKAWQDRHGWAVPVSVNLSSQQFMDERLVDRIDAILRDTGLPPSLLELEITESAMMDASRSSPMLRKLKELDVRLSLDDFGTGYSSLSYLRMFPIQRLKIDRTFVQDITSNADDRAIVETIIAMARHLKMSVIAEGVETMEQLQLLRDNGCDEVQGYYYSKPLPAAELEKFMTERKQTSI